MNLLACNLSARRQLLLRRMNRNIAACELAGSAENSALGGHPADRECVGTDRGAGVAKDHGGVLASCAICQGAGATDDSRVSGESNRVHGTVHFRGRGRFIELHLAGSGAATVGCESKMTVPAIIPVFGAFACGATSSAAIGTSTAHGATYAVLRAAARDITLPVHIGGKGRRTETVKNRSGHDRWAVSYIRIEFAYRHFHGDCIGRRIEGSAVSRAALRIRDRTVGVSNCRTVRKGWHGRIA